MKIFKITTRLWLLFFFILNCTSDRTVSNIRFVKDFKQSIQLVNPQSTGITGLATSDLLAIDTFLIVFDRGKDDVFNVYTTNTHDFLASFGKRGKGPNEFLEPILTGNYNFDSTHNMVLVQIYDMEKKALFTVDIIASLKNDKCVGEEEVLSGVDMFIRKVIHKDENALVFMPENQGRMTVYDFKTGEASTTPFFPETVPITEKFKWAVYHSVFATNTQMRKIAASPLLLGQLDFFDFQGNYLHTTNFNDFRAYQEELVKKNVTKSAAIIGGSCIQAVGNSIYLLNENRPYYTNGQEPEIDGEILVFDWEGAPLQKFKLDQKASCFTFDPVHQRFYIYNPDQLEKNIVYYDFN